MADTLQNLHVGFAINPAGDLVILTFGHDKQGVNITASKAVWLNNYPISAAYPSALHPAHFALPECEPPVQVPGIFANSRTL